MATVSAPFAHPTRDRVRLLAGPVACAAAGAAAVVAVRATNGQTAFSVCPFNAVTGWYCPFCGGTRAVAALAHGDLGTALSFNVVGILLLPVIAALWLGAARVAWRGSGEGIRLPSRGWWVSLAIVLLVFTVWRNLPMLPGGAWLAP